jgi:hypothetical protein
LILHRTNASTPVSRPAELVVGEANMDRQLATVTLDRGGPCDCGGTTITVRRRRKARCKPGSRRDARQNAVQACIFNSDGTFYGIETPYGILHLRRDGEVPPRGETTANPVPAPQESCSYQVSSFAPQESRAEGGSPIAPREPAASSAETASITASLTDENKQTASQPPEP